MFTIRSGDAVSASSSTGGNLIIKPGYGSGYPWKQIYLVHIDSFSISGWVRCEGNNINAEMYIKFDDMSQNSLLAKLTDNGDSISEVLSSKILNIDVYRKYVDEFKCLLVVDRTMGE
jgi:hypothetical protein